MQVKLEPNVKEKLHQLERWGQVIGKLDSELLLDLATNPKRNVKNINVRLAALLGFEQRLYELARKRLTKDLLTDDEVEKLYKLIINEEDFPIMVFPEEFKVEEVTHEKEKEDLQVKKKIIQDIEENVAILKAYALLLIIDYGANTKKFQEIHQSLVKTITGILGNMLGEPNHIFLKEEISSDNNVGIKASRFFVNFVEALYFIDEEAARPFMDIFKVTTNSFSASGRKISG